MTQEPMEAVPALRSCYSGRRGLKNVMAALKRKQPWAKLREQWETRTNRAEWSQNWCSQSDISVTDWGPMVKQSRYKCYRCVMCDVCHSRSPLIKPLQKSLSTHCKQRIQCCTSIKPWCNFIKIIYFQLGHQMRYPDFWGQMCCWSSKELLFF